MEYYPYSLFVENAVIALHALVRLSVPLMALAYFCHSFPVLVENNGERGVIARFQLHDLGEFRYKLGTWTKGRPIFVVIRVVGLKSLSSRGSSICTPALTAAAFAVRVRDASIFVVGPFSVRAMPSTRARAGYSVSVR